MSLFLKLGNESPISFGLALCGRWGWDFRMNVSGNHNARHWLAGAEITRAVNAMRQTLKISNDESGEMAGAMAFNQLLR